MFFHEDFFASISPSPALIRGVHRSIIREIQQVQSISTVRRFAEGKHLIPWAATVALLKTTQIARKHCHMEWVNDPHVDEEVRLGVHCVSLAASTG